MTERELEHEYNLLLVRSVGVLAGHQVTEVDELHRLLVGDDPFGMPGEVHRGLHRLLLELGYERRRVRSKESGRRGFKYVRDFWPIDSGALRGEVETFFAID